MPRLLPGCLVTASFIAIALSSNPSDAQSRSEIRIVGSSTVFPFASAVSEHFGRSTLFSTPVLESTGSGGGIKLFCAGIGVDAPDITNASRRMKESEHDRCAENGVADVTEIKIGYDGVTFAQSIDAPALDLTKAQIFLAIAERVPVDGAIVANPYTRWSEIDPSLPDATIEVLGPPPTSGTRAALTELVLEKGCSGFDAITVLDKPDRETVCTTVRNDGYWVDAGENDNLIIQRLEVNPDTIGIFGFNYLDQNRDKIKAAKIDGVSPTFDAISSGDYAVSRSLFMYVKNAHAEVIPGMLAYLDDFTSESTWGPEGYLAAVGLIPMPEEERAANRKAALSLIPMSF